MSEAWSRKRSFALLLFFLALALFSYRKALSGDFIFDDNLRIADFAVVDGKATIEPLPAYKEGLFKVLATVLSDRPLLMTSIWANYKIGGANPFGYKLVNILLHGFTAWIFFLFLQSAAAFFHMKASFLYAALLAAIFLVHPLHNQAVTMVIQRGVLLSSCFGLISLIFAFRYLEGKSWNYSLGSGFFFLCALLAKPNVLTIPFMILVFSLAARKRSGWLDLFVPLSLAYIFPSVFYLGYRDNFYPESAGAGNWLNYGLVQSKVIFHYVRQFFYPVDLNVSYPIDKIAELRAVWPYCLAHVFFAGLALKYSFRGKLAAAAVLCFYLALLPESGFFPIPHVVFDHRAYFPFLLFCLAAYALLINLSDSRSKKIIFVAALAIIFSLNALNDKRNAENSDYVSWLKNAVNKNRNDHPVNVNLINLLIALKRFEEAAQLSKELSELFPDYPEYRFLANIVGHDSHERMLEAAVLPEFEFLSDSTRSSILQALLEKYKNIPDRIRGMEEAYALLQTQEMYFSREPYKNLHLAYENTRIVLHPYFSRTAASGFLSAYQTELWLDVAPAVQGSERQMPLMLQYLYWKKTKGIP